MFVGAISSPGSGPPGLSAGTKGDSLGALSHPCFCLRLLSEASGFQSSHEVLGEWETEINLMRC